ncbi:MAG: hypothetical protein PUJ35_00455 [Ruminococcus bromii]|nr:hypothetical protein [Ruminococcus bromii]
MRTYLRFTTLSVLGMLGLSVYILADTFFIANFIGADGLAALNLALPVYGVINGTGLLIGVGGATRYMICRTRRGENDDAPFAASLFLAAVTAAVFLTVGLFFAEPLALLLGALFALGAFLFPGAVVAVFSRGDQALTALAVPGLTLFFTNYLFSGVNLQLAARFAAAGQPKRAALLSLLRGVLLVVPCALLGAALFGVTGLWLAVPAAELLTLLCGLWLVRQKTV